MLLQTQSLRLGREGMSCAATRVSNIKSHSCHHPVTLAPSLSSYLEGHDRWPSEIGILKTSFSDCTPKGL